MARLRIVLPAAVALAALLVAGAAAFGIHTEPLANGVVGQPYSYQFKIQTGEGVAPFDWTVKSGGLPPGLGVSSGGLLSGTPVQAGTWKFYMEASYQCCGNPRKYSQRQFTLSVVEGLAIQTPPLPGATVGAPYSVGLTASGGGTQTWSVVGGALPAGLALASNGVLGGTPTTVGSFTFTVQVTDGSRVATREYTVSVIEALALVAPPPSPAVVGSDFTLPLQATGGLQPYTFSVKSGTWPRGLALANGTISGRPRVAGTYAFSIGLVDSLGNAVELPVTLVIEPRLKLPLQVVKQGFVGRTYRLKLLVKGGAKPLTFEIADGDLPPGVRLNARTGVLSGKPRLKGRYPFTVVVADQLGGTHQRSFVLRVK